MSDFEMLSPRTNDTEYRGNDSDCIYKSYEKVTALVQRNAVTFRNLNMNLD